MKVCRVASIKFQFNYILVVFYETLLLLPHLWCQPTSVLRTTHCDTMAQWHRGHRAQGKRKLCKIEPRLSQELDVLYQE